MNKDRLLLKDGTEIVLDAGASLGALQVTLASREDMLAVWGKLTDANLAQAQILNGSGLVVGNYNDLLLVSETSSVAADGTVHTVFNVREKTAEERRLEALEEGQEVQNGAIEELAGIMGGGE